MGTKGSIKRNMRWKPRTAEDRARDRAVNRAIAKAGDQKGPIIVRLGKKPPAKPVARKGDLVAGGTRKKEAKPPKQERKVNSAMADALLAAGVTVKPKAEKKSKPPSKFMSSKAERRKAKKAEQKAQGSLPKPKPAQKQKKKSKGKALAGPSRSTTEIEAKRRSKREKRFLAELRKKAAAMQGELTPSELRWQERQNEIAALIENVQRASFTKLATEWKKHVALAGYIEETGRNSERLDTYTRLIAKIEAEWGRRAKLRFNSEEYFDWPSTDAKRGKIGLQGVDWEKEGYLSYLGYHVGESAGVKELERRAILRRTFKMVLPPLVSPEYVRSWGPPSSAPRLKKIADSIASFVRLRKNRGANSYAIAIAEWEGDLRMLYDEFYVAKFGFGWPSI